ncbi:unnamed protein product, partial [Nesidiocoris tenuis]
MSVHVKFMFRRIFACGCFSECEFQLSLSPASLREEKCLVLWICASRSATPWSAYCMQPEDIGQRGATRLN